MRVIEAQELGPNANEILRDVERGQIVEVMRQGKVVARMVPVQPPTQDADKIRNALADIDRLAAEIGKHWPKGVSAEDAVNDVREDSW